MTLTESPIYFSECLTDDYAFYIAPRTIDHVDTTTDTWFRGQRVGMKKISQIMKTMATGADLPKEKKLTNTSARKRLVQKLRDSGIEATSIAQISGHKSLQSINNYSRINEDAHKRISNILSDNGNRPTCSNSSAAGSSNSYHTVQPSHPAPVSGLPVQNGPSNAPDINHPSISSMDFNVSNNMQQQNSINLPFYGAVLNINTFNMYSK